MDRSHSTRIGQRRRGFSLAGLLLVAFGTLLLLNTTGAVRLGIWSELFSYWPVLLILLGVKIVLAPRAPLICLGVVSLILAGAVTAASLSISAEQTDAPVHPHVTYATPLADTETLQLGMGFTGGSVTVRADQTGIASPSRLLAADFNSMPPRVIQERSGPFTEIYLSTEGLIVQMSDVDRIDSVGDDMPTVVDKLIPSGIADWDLMVSPDVVVDIEIRAGAADLDLDLRELNVRRLVIGAAASDITIWLPANAGQTYVEIEAGVVDIEIDVPQGVAARIDSDTVLSSTRIDSTRFPETAAVHRSPDYDTATNRVSIKIDAAAADVTVG